MCQPPLDLPSHPFTLTPWLSLPSPQVALRVRGSRAKLNFPYEDYVGPNGELVTDAKLEALVREARKALIGESDDGLYGYPQCTAGS